MKEEIVGDTNRKGVPTAISISKVTCREQQPQQHEAANTNPSVNQSLSAPRWVKMMSIALGFLCLVLPK